MEFWNGDHRSSRPVVLIQNAAKIIRSGRERFHMTGMKVWLTAISLLLGLGSMDAANSHSDDSYYVAQGPGSGYYIVEPDSQLFNQLGLYDAPWIDTADALYHGYGVDVLAFRFNRAGVLVAPPAYIAQESPSDFYTRQIGSLVRGRTTTRDVEIMFGHGHSRASRPDGFIYYYALPIYNPFEAFGRH
jgi:hypothetical protein